jgi:hypothetical protein
MDMFGTGLVAECDGDGVGRSTMAGNGAGRSILTGTWRMDGHNVDGTGAAQTGNVTISMEAKD